MENRAHALIAGLFTLLLLAAAIAAVFWFRGEPIAHDRYTLYTRGSVAGLNPQATVRYRGVEVGKVESIEFDRDDPRVILVEISVRSGVPLTRGTYGQLAAQGVTGLSYVQLEDDGSSTVLRDPGEAAQARIELKPSFLERFTGSGEELVARLGSVAASLEIWLKEDNRQQLMRTLAAFELAAQSVSGVAASVQTGAKAVPELAGRAGTTLKHADALLVDLRAFTATLERRSQALDRLAASAEGIEASVDRFARAGSALLAAAGDETLPRLHTLLDEVGRSSRSLEKLIDDLAANPASVVFGRAPTLPGPGEPGFVHEVRR